MSTAISASLPVAAAIKNCVPSNTLLSKPIGPVLDLVGGAFGGVLQGLAIALIVILGVVALILILTKHGAKFLKLIGIVIAIPPGIVLAIIIYNAIWAGINNLC